MTNLKPQLRHYVKATFCPPHVNLKSSFEKLTPLEKEEEEEEEEEQQQQQQRSDL